MLAVIHPYQTQPSVVIAGQVATTPTQVIELIAGGQTTEAVTQPVNVTASTVLINSQEQQRAQVLTVGQYVSQNVSLLNASQGEQAHVISSISFNHISVLESEQINQAIILDIKTNTDSIDLSTLFLIPIDTSYNIEEV